MPVHPCQHWLKQISTIHPFITSRELSKTIENFLLLFGTFDPHEGEKEEPKSDSWGIVCNDHSVVSSDRGIDWPSSVYSDNAPWQWYYTMLVKNEGVLLLVRASLFGDLQETAHGWFWRFWCFSSTASMLVSGEKVRKLTPRWVRSKIQNEVRERERERERERTCAKAVRFENNRSNTPFSPIPQTYPRLRTYLLKESIIGLVGSPPLRLTMYRWKDDIRWYHQSMRGHLQERTFDKVVNPISITTSVIFLSIQM